MEFIQFNPGKCHVLHITSAGNLFKSTYSTLCIIRFLKRFPLLDTLVSNFPPT